MSRLTFTGVLLVTVVGSAVAFVGTNVETSQAAIKSVIDQFYMLHATEDPARLSKLVAHDPDMVNFGTDIGEHIVGWEALRVAFERQWKAFDKPKIAMRDQVIKLSRSGTVAWFSMLVDFEVQSQGKTVKWENARATGVLENRDGQWVVVQFHTSMPVLEPAAPY